MGRLFQICNQFWKTSFYFFEFGSPCLDHRVFASGLRLEIAGLPRSAANLDCGNAIQNISVEKCASIRLDVDDAGVDLDRHLYLLEITWIDADIDDLADRDAIVLNLGALV